MQLKRNLASIFYSFEVLSQQNPSPYVYWSIYLLTILQTFFSFEIDTQSVAFPSSKQVIVPQSITSQSAVFAYLITTLVFQVVGTLALFYLARNQNMSTSHFVNLFLKLLFWTSFINYSVNICFLHGFQDTTFKNVGITLYSLIFLSNLTLFNFTLQSKRIWTVNQLLVLDLLRLASVWVNGSKPLIIIMLSIYLLVSGSVMILRPIFHLFKQNKVAHYLISFSLYLSIFTIARICSTQSDTSQNIAFQVIISCLFTFFISTVTKKWINYKIEKLYTDKQEGQEILQSNFTVNGIVMLLYLEENFKEYEDSIKLYLVKHSRSCTLIGKCPCYSFIQSFVRKNDSKNNEKINGADALSNPNSRVKDSQKHDHTLKDLFSEFILFTITSFLRKQLPCASPSQSPLTKKPTPPSKKQNSINQQRSLLTQHLPLHHILLQKLLTTSPNLTTAYFHLSSLHHHLSSLNLLSIPQMGTLSYLKHQIIQKKHISLETDTIYTNKFCVQYFNCQKVVSRLEEMIGKAVGEMQGFWNDAKMKEPDERKLLGMMARFNKYHEKVMAIYAEVSAEKSKQSIEIRMMFKLYENVLELQGDHRFFKGNCLIEDPKQNTLKNAASMNLKMYSEQSTTHIISFSINEQTFGNINYTSSGATDIFSPQFTNISSFLPSECHSFHQAQIRKFLSTDHNYFQHTLSNPCHIKISSGKEIKPVDLETHLMAFLTINQIEMIAFFKPLVEDQKIMKKKGTCKNIHDKVQDDLVVCIDGQGKVVACTKSFEHQKDRMFEGKEVEEIFNHNFVARFISSSLIQLQLSDSDYQATLIKKIPRLNQQQPSHPQQKPGDFLYYIKFENMIEKNTFRSQVSSQIQDGLQQKSTVMLQRRRKPQKSINLKTLLAKTLDNELAEIDKFDEIKNRVNTIWDVTSRPDKHKLKRKWTVFMIFFLMVFAVFLAATSIFLYKRRDEFQNFNSFLNLFANNQVATVQAVTYAREINVNLYKGDKNKVALVPKIVEQVDRLSEIMYKSLMQLNPYLNEQWMCLDVLQSGRRIMGMEKAYVVVNNYVLNTITNIIENQRKLNTSLNFSPILGQLRVPYTQTQLNFIKAISNTVSFVIPSQMMVRQKTLKKTFLPSISVEVSKAFVHVPIMGITVCIFLVTYFFYMDFKLNKLTVGSFTMFQKLKVIFAQKKLNLIARNIKMFNNNKLEYADGLSSEKKLAWKNLSNVFERNSTLAFGTFIANTIASNNSNRKFDEKLQTPSSASSFNVPQMMEDTDRELYPSPNGNNLESSLKTQQKSLNQSLGMDNIKQLALSEVSENIQPQNQKDNTHSQNAERNLELGRQQVVKHTCHKKMRCLWVALPISVYFIHVFFISLEFNRFMKSVLLMKNQMLYRKQSMVYIWNYQYELGLFESFVPLADYILAGMESTYKSQQLMTFYEAETEKFFFGKLQNYQRAKQTFMYGNICDFMHLINRPQPSFNINFTKEQCETVFDGVLQTGYKQTLVKAIESMRSLVLQNMKPQFLPPFKRFEYLNDIRLQNYNKVLPYMMEVFRYIDSQFQKDFDYFVTGYEIFILVDTPLMVVLCFVCIMVYAKRIKTEMKKEVSIIKCCFLMIGHKNFLTNPSILKDDVSQDQGSRYHFLQ